MSKKLKEISFSMGLPGGPVVKKQLIYNAGDMGSILDQEYPLDKEMGTHFRILAWEIPQTEEPDGIQPMGSQRVGHDLVTKQQQTTTQYVPRK